MYGLSDEEIAAIRGGQFARFAAPDAALENYRARFNRVFDVASDGLYRKGLRFKQRQVVS